jgi:hypothetical protein
MKILLFACALIGAGIGHGDKPAESSSARPVPFHGSWISKSYLETLLETKSPLLAQHGNQSIIVPELERQPTSMGYQFHEGVDRVVVRWRNTRSGSGLSSPTGRC